MAQVSEALAKAATVVVFILVLGLCVWAAFLAPLNGCPKMYDGIIPCEHGVIP